MSRRTEIKFRYMADRQDLIKTMETQKQGLAPYMMDRVDMYWADVNITDDGLKAEMSYCIDASVKALEHSWTLSYQYGPKEYDTVILRNKVLNKWNLSEERKQAKEWVSNLIIAGYYDHGRFGAPNLNASRCQHCNSMFENGTSHPHTYLDNWNNKEEHRIIYHHKLMEKTIKEKGLFISSVSALPDIESLEDKGVLEPVVIGE